MPTSRHSSFQRRSSGQLIIFEGPDGVGKTVISQLLVKEFTRRREKAIWLAFPGREPDTLGSTIYALHHDPRFDRIHPLSRQFLHIAAHIDAIETRILPALDSGVSVVLDRYWWSTFAYGAAAGASLPALRLGIRAERIAWRGVQPSIAFLLTRTSAEPTAQRSTLLLLDRLYRQLAARERRRHTVKLIENNRTLSETFSVVAADVFAKTASLR